jgi:signal transduction histidine kinase/CheY-like chemotaxis protein
MIRWRQILARSLVTPAAAAGLALVLVALSLALAIVNERAGRAEVIRDAQVQAAILAGSVAAPLAFDDRAAARQYVNALQASPAVEAAAAYDTAGRVVAGFRREGAPLPVGTADVGDGVGGAHTDDSHLTVTAPVAENGLRLGSVYLRLDTEPLPRRLSRYFGIAVIILMSSLLVAVLGRSRARLAQANGRLQRETAEREKAEEALRQSQKMEAMGQLTGGVAHDFNNLLMVASSGLDLMARTDDPVRRARLQDGIRQAIDRGASLTQQLLAFARRAPVRPEVVDPGASLEAMRSLLERSLREDITVEVRPDKGVWPVEVDPSQFEVAILNTAINARDAMPGGGKITLTAANVPAAEAELGRDIVRICVIDTGMGLDPALAKRVFEPFFTTKGVGQGTGLGLSQVYGFARAAGGAVRFDSTPGEGSTVCIELPRSEKPAPPPPAATPAAKAERRTGRILLVEDDDHVAELVTQMLDELGYANVRVGQAAAALETLAADPAFDLVFSDMVMPGEMNGLDLARELARRYPGLPVVLTTGFSDAAKVAAEQGVRLLLKPYRMEALQAEVAAALAAGGRPTP